MRRIHVFAFLLIIRYTSYKDTSNIDTTTLQHQSVIIEEIGKKTSPRTMFPVLSMSYWLVPARTMSSHSCLFYCLSELQVRPEFAFLTGLICRFLPQQQRRYPKRILSVSRREGLEIEGSKSGFSKSADDKKCTGPGLSKSSIRRRRHDGSKFEERFGAFTLAGCVGPV